MADTLSPADRSILMARIKGRDTKPEREIRSIVETLGYKVELCAGHLPGKPDIVLRKLGKIIFVHGCFWHQHEGCRRARRPRTRAEFWDTKLDGNIARDRQVLRRLRRLGWSCAVIWECETKDNQKLQNRLTNFISRKRRIRPDKAVGK